MLLYWQLKKWNYQIEKIILNKEEVLKGINTTQKFMIENKEVDMFILGHNPNTVFYKTNNS